MALRNTAWIAVTSSILLAVACGGGSADSKQSAPETPTATAPSAVMSTTSPAESDPATAGPGELVGSWTLVAIDKEPIPEVGKTPTLEILEDGSAAGVGGVNRFQTQVEIEDGRLSFGPAAATKMAGPPAAMKIEAEYLARLGAVSSFEVDGASLRLWAGDNQALTFERREE